MSLHKKAAASIVALATAFSLTACGGGDDSDVIKVGTTDQGQKQWQVFTEEAKAEGLNVELVPFGDYSLPNRALEEGEIDVNNFQHLMFLADFNVNSGTDLTPIGATEIIPLALFYKDHDNIKDVEDAKEVAIPNDPTNQGRALHMLAENHLVVLKDDSILSPTPADVDEAKSKIKVTPVDAAQTVTAYQDGKPAVINNSFLDRGNIDPTSAIAQDDPQSPSAEPFINAFVTKADRKDDPDLKKLVDVWHSQKVQDALREQSKGTSVEVKKNGPELEKILDNVEARIKESK
ncbi:MetQ/NlpA family ABC transporter substrate-binding protein [Corynebacterium anserum]|uniref:Methionine ABC transporter substrate-binding protein n=1 Tax=Corynebacterium anserum TaxID=2684406 RepID=A0A7G7YPV3_9CORY|nr:MetQ/NlpA family ABC transporter substrate-binding protein [Corynebacterium anserum]MBC2682171.1 methionine ABC transporter substrate-binding protein [Corynebacterium anserum]QNH96523.1 methionine ABC transporter substrate-binding protein [Corynebacterium anserum]